MIIQYIIISQHENKWDNTMIIDEIIPLLLME